jgi:hypothetical protein
MTPRFINTGAGRLVNVDHVRSVRCEEAYPIDREPYIKTLTFELTDGTEIGPIVPAPALLDYLFDGRPLIASRCHR